MLTTKKTSSMAARSAQKAKMIIKKKKSVNPVLIRKVPRARRLRLSSRGTGREDRDHIENMNIDVNRVVLYVLLKIYN